MSCDRTAARGDRRQRTTGRDLRQCRRDGAGTVFTGYGWAFPDSELTEAKLRAGWPDYSAAGDRRIDLQRMKAYPGQHSQPEKRLFAGKP